MNLSFLASQYICIPSFKKSILFLLGLFLITFQPLFSQSDDEQGSTSQINEELNKAFLIPNAPEAAAFAKYGDIPTNLYTGTPNISIPLFEFSGKEIKLPMSLSYDASGVKVEQLATQVGLNWNLNVGGRISRVTNGLPDDYISCSPSSYTTLNDTEVRTDLNTYVAKHPNFDSEQEVIDYFLFLKDIQEQEIDIQTDLYSLSALGINDYIVIDHENQEAKALNNPRLKVNFTRSSAVGNSITDWTVTTDNGVKYYFEKAEVTYYQGNDNQNSGRIVQEFNSSWVLTRVENALGTDYFSFEYQDLGYWSQPISVLGASTLNAVLESTNPLSIPALNLGNFQTTYKIKQQFLSKISHNGEQIVSVTLKSRQDIGIASAIDKIQINESGDTSEIVKTIVFNHDYFGDTPSSREEDKRLRLDKIVFEYPGTTDKETYALTYFSPNEVPATDSFSQDYLGYYNSTNNQVLYPGMSFGEHVFVGADRSSVFDKSIVGTLKRIQYPTGGYTDFIYEAHQSPYNRDDITGSVHTKTYANVSLAPGTDSTTSCGACCIDIFGNPPMTTSSIFRIDDATIYDLYYTGNSMSEAYIIRLSTATDTLDSNLNPYSYDDLFNQDCSTTRVRTVWDSYTLGNTQNTLALQTGTYQILLVNPEQARDTQQLVISNQESDDFPLGEGAINRAGIRIASIQNYSALGVLATSKSFNYTTAMGGSDSSGMIISDIKLYHTEALKGDDVDSRTSLTLYGSIPQGSRPYIAYEKVFEVYEDALNQSDNGYTTHTFYTGNNTGLLPGTAPSFVNGYKMDVEVGKTKKETIHNASKDTLSSKEILYNNKISYGLTSYYVKKDQLHIGDLLAVRLLEGTQKFTYELIDWEFPTLQVDTNGDGLAETITLYDLLPLECNDPNLSCYNGYYGQDNILRPSLIQGQVGFPTKVNRTSFFTSGSTTDVTDYDYAHELNYLLRRQAKTTSEGNVESTVFYYPEDYPTDSTMIALTNKNHIAKVVKKISYENDSIKLSTFNTTYKAWDNGLVLPEYLQTAKGDHALENRVQYESYDPYGNPRQVRRVGGTPTTYLWGYDGQYLIAKIEGATYNEVETALGGLSTIDESHLSQIDNLRSTKTQWLITTYRHQPLVGVTEIIAPNGIATEYDYDSFNRLKTVKDPGGTLQEYEYHYANPSNQ